jgi:hypothetical protein
MLACQLPYTFIYQLAQKTASNAAKTETFRRAVSVLTVTSMAATY